MIKLTTLDGYDDPSPVWFRASAIDMVRATTRWDYRNKVSVPCGLVFCAGCTHTVVETPEEVLALMKNAND